MMIDFKEIASAKGGGADQDTFELFAREFFAAVGFEVLEGPDRGADGGRDIIVIENRKGIMGTTEIKWLVSCKHYAHSGKSVGADDEINIADRVAQFTCDGFIGFYSTIPSTGLQNRLKSMTFEHQIFDKELIERKLLEDGPAYALIKRFFPESWKKISSTTFEMSNLLKRYYPLKCDLCGKDLLQSPHEGILAFVTDRDDCFFVRDAYCACYGECDRILEHRFASIGLTAWWDLSEIIIPRRYLEKIIGLSDNHEKNTYTFSDKAYEKVKEIYIRLSQLVMRKHTEEEDAQLDILDMLP